MSEFIFDGSSVVAPAGMMRGCWGGGEPRAGRDCLHATRLCRSCFITLLLRCRFLPCRQLTHLIMPEFPFPLPMFCYDFQ